MIKIINILIFVILISFYGSTSFAITKPDCTQYTNKTFAGTLEKRRCLKGLPPKEKISLGTRLKKLNPFKKKTN